MNLVSLILKHPIVFSFPRRLIASGWIQHVPFAFFITDLLRPKLFVELGAFAGVSYCAFCQAVQVLNLQTKCYAVDTWQGDPHAGVYGEDVLNDLKIHHDRLYDGFSTLLRSSFSDAVESFDDNSIDLLHIDGYHTYEAVRNDFYTWLPKMSDNGVVLFHDISVHEKDFGVWKLWGELSQKYPHFNFHHGSGLGVLYVGKKVLPDWFNTFSQASSLQVKLIQSYFALIGKFFDFLKTLKTFIR